MEYKKVFLISLGHMSCDVNGHALPALLPYLAAVHGFDYQSCGLLAFAYSAVSSLVQPVLGLFADKVSCSWFIPLGILLAGCSFGATGFFGNYWAIFAVLMLAGVGGALFHPEGARYANLVSGGRKGIGMSVFAVGGNMGTMVGPLFVLVAVGGIPLGSFTLGGFGLSGTAVFAVWGLTMSAIIYERMSAWNMASAAGSKRGQGDAEGRNDWRSFGVLSGSILARSGVTMSFTTYLPLYWHRVFQQPEHVGSLVLIFFCGVCIVCNLLGGAASDRWGFVRTIRFSAFLLIPTIAVFPFVANPWLALLLLVPMAIALYAPFSSVVVLGQRYLARNMGLASGITLGVATSIGGAVSPVLGWVADNFGGLSTAMHIYVPVAICGAVCACLLKEQPREA